MRYTKGIMLASILRSFTLVSIFIGLFLFLPAQITAEDQIEIESTFAQKNFFDTDQVLKVSLYKLRPTIDQEDEDAIDVADEKQRITIGLFDAEDVLQSTVFEVEFYDTPSHHLKVHSVQLRDLNHDNREDIIVNIIETGDDFFKSTVSTFLINMGDHFQEIKQSLNQEEYEFVSPTILRVTTPLYAFGKPYDDLDNDPKKQIQWRDYYAFEGDKLAKISFRYPNHYRGVKEASRRNVERLLGKVRDFKISASDPTNSQLQLNDYFTRITDQKILIQRCESVLNFRRK